MKKYIIKTTDMTDEIHLELMKYTKKCVGELSRLNNLYVLTTNKKNILKIKELSFVEHIEEDEEWEFNTKERKINKCLLTKN